MTGAAYQNPVRCHVARGAFARLAEVLAGFKPRRILVVLGGQSFRRSEFYPKFLEMLGPYLHFFSSPVSSNPQFAFLNEELARLKRENFDLVLAVGGGSVIDAAKLFALLPAQAITDLDAYVDKPWKLTAPGRPLIAVPTTAGTGSEVTPFSSLETRDKKKFSLTHPALYPAVALVDSDLCLSMPAYVTACTGFDALSQAIESFWSVQACPESQAHSLRGLEAILSGFERVMKNPGDREARFAMSLGSCEAGLGISHAKTTAVHSVSYPMTAHFNVAHGHACALTLAEFVRFNAPVLKETGKPLLARFNAPDYEKMATAIEGLMGPAGLERSLSKVGIDEKGREVVVRDGFRPDRVKNNPRPLSAEDLKKILKKIQ